MKKEYVLSSPNITTNSTRMNTALPLALSALALTFVLVIPSSAQLTLNNRRLLASPGTYSGDIALPSEAVLKVRGGGVYVLSGVLRDGLGKRGSRLTAEGDGTIALTGDNTYTGATAVTSGTLVLVNPQGYQTSSLTVSRGATLEYDATNQGGSSSLSAHFLFARTRSSVRGSGTVNLRGTNGEHYGFGGDGQMNFNLSAGGQLNITGGSWQWGWGQGSFASNLGSLDISAGAELRNSDAAMQFDKLTGKGSIGTAFHSNTASLTVGVDGGTSAFSGRIIDGGSYNGVECAAVSLTKQGKGVITLTGDNAYTGATAVTSGTLVLVNPQGYQTSSLTVSRGATLEYDATTQGGSSSLSAHFLFGRTRSSVMGSGTVNLRGTNGKHYGFGGDGQMTFNLSAGGQLNITGGSWQWGWGQGSFASNLGSLDISAGAELRNSDAAMQFDKLTGEGTIGNAFHSNTASLTVGVGGGTSAFAGRIIDGGNYNGVECAAVSLTKQGGGVITLTGDNAYRGATEVTSGTLKAGNLNALGTGGATVNRGGILDLRGFDAISNTLSNNGGVILRDAGLLLNGKCLTSDPSVPYSLDVVLKQHSVLTQTGSGTYTLSGIISGAYNLTCAIGSGNKLTLTGDNAYTGATAVTSGTLVLVNPQGYQTSSLTVSRGATLEYDATNQGGSSSLSAHFLFARTRSSVRGSGTVNLRGTNGEHYGFGGDGQMTFNLSAGGQVNIRGGSWQWGWGQGSFASNLGSLDISAGAELRNSDAAMQFDKLTGEGSRGNAFHSNTASLTVGVGGGTSAFAGRIIDGGNYNGVECAAVSLTKQGKGVITLTGDNAYTGATAVTSGTLVLVNPQGYQTSSLTVSRGATLEYDATTQGGSSSLSAHFLFGRTRSSVMGSGTVNLRGTNGK